MAAILSTIRRSFEVANDAEITFEANPDSVTPRLLRRLKGEGFNRVSLGIQSDDDAILDVLGRPHTYDDAVDAVRMIRRAGFRNLSVDLIYGLPQQTLESWQKTLTHVLQLKPEHISCYGLKIEEGTPFCAMQHRLQLPDADMQADMYLATVEILRSKGYRQYEISNFCLRGRESRHNLKYWTGGEYLGFGPDASSDFAGKRYALIRDLALYVEGIREETVRRLFLVQIRPQQEVKRVRVAKETGTGAATKTEVKKAPIRNKATKVGPNDPCPCGSGKKYKKCCMHKDVSNSMEG